MIYLCQQAGIHVTCNRNLQLNMPLPLFFYNRYMSDFHKKQEVSDCMHLAVPVNATLQVIFFLQWPIGDQLFRFSRQRIFLESKAYSPTILCFWSADDRSKTQECCCFVSTKSTVKEANKHSILSSPGATRWFNTICKFRHLLLVSRMALAKKEMAYCCVSNSFSQL